MENRVEELRKRLGMNQEDFAKALKVSRQTVSSIETGKYNPPLEFGCLSKSLCYFIAHEHLPLGYHCRIPQAD